MNVAQPLIQASLIGEAIDAGPVLVFVADEQMQYVAVNGYACTLLGYSRKELLGLRVSDIAPAPGGPEAYAHLVEAGEVAGTTTLLQKDGRLLQFVYRARKTSIAGMELYVAVGWPTDGGAEVDGGGG